MRDATSTSKPKSSGFNRYNFEASIFAHKSPKRNQHRIAGCLSFKAKLVACVLANYANKDTGQGYPSIATLADRASLGRSTVCEALKELETAGIVERTKRGAKGQAGGRTSTLYRLRQPATHGEVWEG